MMSRAEFTRALVTLVVSSVAVGGTLATADPSIDRVFHILFCHGDDSVGVLTMDDGVELAHPSLWTSREMDDAEIGYVIRKAIE